VEAVNGGYGCPDGWLGEGHWRGNRFFPENGNKTRALRRIEFQQRELKIKKSVWKALCLWDASKETGALTMGKDPNHP